MFRRAVKQRSFARLDYSADFDDNIPEPVTEGHVSKKLKGIMSFTDEWVRMPDYQRVGLTHPPSQGPANSLAAQGQRLTSDM